MIYKLKYWLQPKYKLLEDFSKYTLDKSNWKKRRIFIDRNSDVLFVAHIDTIQIPKFIRTRKTKSKKLKRIYAWGLDDRLGCMIASDLAKELNADLLITDHEESFGTTARYHDCKEYNWICEFDRHGNDVVTYGLDSLEFKKALREYWNIGIGSYSDICELNVDCCCMNLGIGYELDHSKDSYVAIKTMNKQIELFKQFYLKYKDVKFEYIDSKTECCDVCGIPNAMNVYGYYLCEDCFYNMVYEHLYDKEIELYKD